MCILNNNTPSALLVFIISDFIFRNSAWLSTDMNEVDACCYQYTRQSELKILLTILDTPLVIPTRDIGRKLNCDFFIPHLHSTPAVIGSSTINWIRIVRLQNFSAHLLLRLYAPPLTRLLLRFTLLLIHLTYLCSYFTLGNCQDLSVMYVVLNCWFSQFYSTSTWLLVHLCGTICPFISRTAIWLLQLSCAILSLIFFLSTDFVLSAFGVWSHKRAI